MERRNKVAFVKKTASDIISLKQTVAKHNAVMSELEKSFSNPRSVFDKSTMRKALASLNTQFNYFQNQLALNDNRFREALRMHTPTAAIQSVSEKLCSLINKIATLKAVAEESLRDEEVEVQELEIDDNGNLIESSKVAECKKEAECKDEKPAEASKCEKAGLEDALLLVIDDDGNLITGNKECKEAECKASDCKEAECKATKEVKADKAEDKVEEKVEAETEEKVSEELPAETPKEEVEVKEETKDSEVEAETEETEEAPEEEVVEEEKSEITQEDLDTLNDSIVSELYKSTERIENIEEQLGIEPTIKASVNTSKNVQKMKLASSQNKLASDNQDILESIIRMEIR